MRLAHFVHGYPEATETFISRQVEGLAARGHLIDVFTHGPPLHRDSEEGSTARVVPLEARDPGAAGPAPRLPVTVFRAAASAARRPGAALAWLGGSGAGVRRGIATIPLAERLAARGPYEIVHCHYGDVGLSHGAAAALWGAPLVVSFYGYDCSAFVRARGPDVYRRLFGMADRILVLGETMRGRLEALGAPADRIAVQPLGVDPVEYAPADRSERFRLLTVARLVPKKGIDVALRAVARVAPEYPGLRYEIIGAGPLEAELRSLAAQLGVTPLVEFSGMRPQSEVRDAMRRASVFLLASRTAPDGDEEGTPTVLLEAASAGLPALSTRHAGIPDVVEDGETGFLVPEGDPGALEARLRELLSSRELRDRMGAAARGRVLREHDVRRLAERLERHYEDARRSASSRRASGPRKPARTSS